MAGLETACVALWPAPPCGWRGQCVGGTCQCDEGWALSGLDTQGADQCIKYRPITGALHVTWAAVVPPLALLYASNVLLDWRVRRGSVGSGDRVAAALFGVSLVMNFTCALRGALRSDNEVGSSRASIALLITAVVTTRVVKGLFQDRQLQCSEALGLVKPETHRLLTRVLVVSIILSASQLLVVWGAVSALLPGVWIWRIFFLANIVDGFAGIVMVYVCMVPLHAAIGGLIEDMGECAGAYESTVVLRQSKTSLAARITFAKTQVPVMVIGSAIALLPGLTGGFTTYMVPLIASLLLALQAVRCARQLRAHHKAIAQVSACRVTTRTPSSASHSHVATATK
jgi:hypothetical protein